jgi:DNA-binding MarR family transcriptional regulator
MTGQADRLANAGLIVRRPDPDDRRTVLVSLTPEGQGAAEDALTAYLGAGEQALSVLTSEERETLAEILRKLLMGLEGPAKKPAPEDSQTKAPKVRDPRPKARFQAE